MACQRPPMASGCSSHRRVEPSRSVNRNVTVPLGSSLDRRADRRGALPTEVRMLTQDVVVERLERRPTERRPPRRRGTAGSASNTRSASTGRPARANANINTARSRSRNGSAAMSASSAPMTSPGRPSSTSGGRMLLDRAQTGALRAGPPRRPRTPRRRTRRRGAHATAPTPRSNFAAAFSGRSTDPSPSRTNSSNRSAVDLGRARSAAGSPARTVSIRSDPNAAAQARHERLERVRRARRRHVAPEHVDQAVRRHHLVGVDRQDRQHPTLLRARRAAPACRRAPPLPGDRAPTPTSGSDRPPGPPATFGHRSRQCLRACLRPNGDDAARSLRHAAVEEPILAHQPKEEP